MREVLTAALAAMCDGNKSGPERLTDFEFVEAFACVYGDAVGLVVTGLIVWGGISISIYLTTGDVRIPAVLLLLTGGAIIPQVAAPGLTLAVLVLLLTASGLATALYYRWSR